MTENPKHEMRRQAKREHTQRTIGRRGLNEDEVRRLMDAGYDNLRKLREASDEELQAISGIGPGMVRKIRETLGGG